MPEIVVIQYPPDCRPHALAWLSKVGSYKDGLAVFTVRQFTSTSKDSGHINSQTTQAHQLFGSRYVLIAGQISYILLWHRFPFHKPLPQ